MTTTLPDSKVLPPLRFKLPSLSDRLTSLLNQLQPSPEALILISALLIGGGSGLFMVLFHHLIDLCETLAFRRLLNFTSVWGAWTLVCIPVLGGLAVGLLRWCFPNSVGQGFSALLSQTRPQTISPLRPLIKMLAAALSLGTGASLGPEGPSAEIGSNVGILLAQGFQVSKERYRLLLGAGAAAGIAAGFNAPIAGVFFALEVVLGPTFSTPAASLILLSAVVSSVVAQTLLGARPAFDLPSYQVVSHWEWIYYLGLGVLASLVSIAYTQLIKLVHACFQGEISGLGWLSKLPELIKPALGGICIGAIALPLPHILGVGYGTLEVILQGGGEFPLQLLALLLGAKLIATAISLGSGLVGGVFAPAMFLGACLGAIYGHVLSEILPTSLAHQIGPPAAYAMVGMAAVLASSVKAPLTAILLLFELTQNYLIILPLMVAVGMGVWIVEALKSRQAVEGLNLQEMGVDLDNQDEQEALQQVAIAAIMSHTYLALPDSMSVLEAAKTMLQNKSHTALVLDGAGQLAGVFTLTDIRRSLTDSRASAMPQPNPTLREICTAEILYAYEDEPATEALDRMRVRGIHLLPVVTRENPRQILGVIERAQIELASHLALTQGLLQPQSQ